jgi:hypothetical protein
MVLSGERGWAAVGLSFGNPCTKITPGEKHSCLIALRLSHVAANGLSERSGYLVVRSIVGQFSDAQIWL